jgi:hypothetical protein
MQNGVAEKDHVPHPNYYQRLNQERSNLFQNRNNLRCHHLTSSLQTTSRVGHRDHRDHVGGGKSNHLLNHHRGHHRDHRDHRDHLDHVGGGKSNHLLNHHLDNQDHVGATQSNHHQNHHREPVKNRPGERDDQNHPMYSVPNMKKCLYFASCEVKYKYYSIIDRF